MNKLALIVVMSAASMPALAENGFSVDLLLGKADQESTIKNIGSISGDDTSIGIRGLYEVNQNFSLELAYHDYGEAEERYLDSFGDTITDKVNTTAVNIGMKGVIPLQNGFSVNGRLGLSIWDIDFEETDSAFPGEVFKASDDGNDFYYGIGVQYAISNQASIGAEYTVTEMDAKIEGVSVDHDVENLALVLTLNF